MKKLNYLQQDILECIYFLKKNKKKVKAKDICSILNKSSSRISQEIKKLKYNNFIKKNNYTLISLCDKGIFKAKKIIFKHNTIKSFLIKILKIKTITAEKEACLMEHFISNETIKAMIKKITNSKENNTIKSNEVSFFFPKTKKLSELTLNTKAKILKIEEKCKRKQQLLELGIIPNETIKIVSIAPLGDPIEIATEEFNFSLHLKDAKNIIVENIKEK